MLLSRRRVENFGGFFFVVIFLLFVCFNIRPESNTLLMNENISEINEMKCNAFHAMQA